ncbi:MAG: SulP family inorganic anion transporter, partial [Flavobacterium sp.]
VIIILKQIPHAFGYDPDFEGDEAFLQPDGHNSITEIFGIFDHVQLGSILIAVLSLIILIAWGKMKVFSKLKIIPAALVAVIVSIVLNEYFTSTGSSLQISKEHLVSLPIPQSFAEFTNIIVTPDFSGFLSTKVWIVGLTIAIVASIETLLCIEAADRMDVQRRYTNTNVELKAQGIGNIISSLIGGLPMTSVVVRTSANNEAGAKSKLSAILHGVLLLVSVLSIPTLLNKIPLATLAAVLLLVGYKLANPKTVLHFWHKGKYQFIPFIATFVAVVLLDLLKGVALGMIISAFFVLQGNMKRAYRFRKEEYQEGDIIHIELAQEISFLNKSAIKTTLNELPANSKVVINATETVYIAHDVLDLITEFHRIKAKELNIKVKLIGFKTEYNINNSDDYKNTVTIEHRYNVRKRKMETVENTDTFFS